MKWLILLLLPFSLHAQKPGCSCGIQGLVSAGMIAGQSPVKPLFQLGAGLSYKRFFTGIGAGLDPYRFHSVPLFADLRMNFGKNRFGFLYANLGYNIPYDNEGAENWDDWFRTTDKFTGGFYMDAGFGYRVRLGSWHRLLMSAGFTHKRLTNTIGYTYPCIVPPCPEDVYKYRYDLGRVVAKLSWELGKVK